MSTSTSLRSSLHSQHSRTETFAKIPTNSAQLSELPAAILKSFAISVLLFAHGVTVLAGTVQCTRRAVLPFIGNTFAFAHPHAAVGSRLSSADWCDLRKKAAKSISSTNMVDYEEVGCPILTCQLQISSSYRACGTTRTMHSGHRLMWMPSLQNTTSRQAHSLPRQHIHKHKTQRFAVRFRS